MRDASIGAGRRQDPHLAHWLSGALAIVAVIVSAVELLFPGVFHDAPMTAGNARGTALVILAIAVPVVVVSMILSARGSLRAWIVWLGALGYIVYNSLFFAYGIHFNSLFLLYAAQLSLAVWSIVALLRLVDLEELRGHFAPGTPVRVIASYLLVLQSLFALLWLRDVIPAIVGNTAPASLAGTGMITNPIEMTDFAFSFPVTAIAVVCLWRRRAWGYLLAGALLVYGAIEALSIAADQWFGHLSDPTASADAVPVFLALTLVSLVPLIVFLRGLREGPEVIANSE